MKILYIDDDDLFPTVMREAVKFVGTHDLLTVNTTEAFNLLDSGQSFDLILIENDIPSIEGLTLAEQFRQRYPDMPIIALTSDREYGEKWKEAGFTDYIYQPLNVDILRALFVKYQR